MRKSRTTIRDNGDEALVISRPSAHPFVIAVLVVVCLFCGYAFVTSLLGFFGRGADWFVLVFAAVFLFGAVFVLVFAAVFLFGAVAGLLMLSWFFFGEETIRADAERVLVRRSVLGAGKSASCPVSAIEKIMVRDPARKQASEKAPRSPICLKTEGGVVTIGLAMSAEESREAALLLAAKTGKAGSRAPDPA